MGETVRSICRHLKKTFKKAVPEYKIDRDIRNFLYNLREMEIDQLNNQIELFENKYNSRRIIENIAIVAKSAILAKLTLSQYYRILRPEDFQDFFDCFSFLSISESYEESKGILIKNSLKTIKFAVENHGIQDLLKIGDALSDIRDILELKTFNKLTEKISCILKKLFINANLSDLHSEFLEFNHRYQQVSENFIKSRLKNLSCLNSLKEILRELKISDSSLNKQIESILTKQLMIAPFQSNYKRFTLHKYQLPEFKTIRDMENYSIHSLTAIEEVPEKAKKYFFGVYVDDYCKSTLKVTRFSKLSSKEFEIFKLKNSEQFVALPEILGVTYSNQNFESIVNNFNRGVPRESHNFTSNVLKIFFERFYLVSNILVTEDIILKSLSKLLNTLTIMNEKKLFVPIIFIDSLAVNETKTEFMFIDFKRIKRSEQFRFNAIEYSWLKRKYKGNYWLEKIGVDENQMIYHIETLQSWCLAQIFETLLKSSDARTDIGNSVFPELSMLLNIMRQSSIEFSRIKESISASETESMFFLSNTSLNPTIY